jgi:hypothetical protein
VSVANPRLRAKHLVLATDVRVSLFSASPNCLQLCAESCGSRAPRSSRRRRLCTNPAIIGADPNGRRSQPRPCRAIDGRVSVHLCACRIELYKGLAGRCSHCSARLARGCDLYCRHPVSIPSTARLQQAAAVVESGDDDTEGILISRFDLRGEPLDRHLASLDQACIGGEDDVRRRAVRVVDDVNHIVQKRAWYPL